MNTLIHADIFFFISSIGFSIFFILLFIALMYTIRLLRNLNKMATKVEENITSISDEAREMISDFRDSSLISLLFRSKKKRRTAKVSDK